MKSTSLLLLSLGFFTSFAGLAADCPAAEKAAEAKEQRSLQALRNLRNLDCLGGDEDKSKIYDALSPKLKTDELPLVGAVRVFRAASHLLEQNSTIASPDAIELKKRLQLGISTALKALEEGDGSAQSVKGASWAIDADPNADGTAIGISMPDTPASAGVITIGDDMLGGCVDKSTEKCSAAFTSVRDAIRIVRILGTWPISELAKPELQKQVASGKIRKQSWDDYFTTALPQYPWELGINSWLGTAKKGEGYAAGFMNPPNYQWIVFHPDVSLEYLDDAADGQQFKPTLLVELVGYNQWKYNADSGKAMGGLGASIIIVYADRADVSDVGYGLMLHFKNKYSIAVTERDGEYGVLVNLNLSELFRAKEAEFDDWKESFRDELLKQVLPPVAP